jgi:hypothetical protein
LGAKANLAGATFTGTVRTAVLAHPTPSIYSALFTNHDTGSVGIVATVAGNKALTVRGAGSQTADLQQWQNSAGTVIGGLNANAQLFTGTTAPITTGTGGATTAASGDGTTATITTSSAHGLAVGDRVTVAGVTPTGYNGTFIVTGVPSTTQVSYLNATTGSQTIAGTVATDAQASITSRSAGTRGLVLRGASGQTASLLAFQNSSGTTGGFVTAGGDGYFQVVNSSWFMNVQNALNTNVALTVRGATNQNVDLQRWTTVSAGTTLGGVGALGQIFTGSTAPISPWSVSVTAASASSATVATYTYAGSFQLVAVGQVLTISGFTTQAYFNGSFTVTAIGGSSGAWTFTVVGSGFTVASATQFGTFTIPTQSSITPTSAGSKGLAIRAVTDQTANLFEIVDRSGVTRLSMTEYGSVQIGSTGAYGARLNITPSTNTTLGIAMRLNLNHSVDAMQIQTNTGTVLTGINADGQIYTGSTSTIKGATTAITAASAASTSVATYTIGTVSTVNPVDIGQLVTIAGFSAETYFNGTFAVSAIGGSSGAWTFTVNNPSANFTVASATVMGTYQIPAQISITPSSAGTIGQIIRGASNQVANLQEWQNSAGTVLSYLSNLGGFYGPIIRAYGTTSTIIPMLVQGAASQSVDLQQWQNNSGSVLAKVASDGSITGGPWVNTLNSQARLGEAFSGGRLQMSRATSAISNPGTNAATLYYRDGTTTGTLRLAVRAGTAGVETTLIDNIDTSGTDTSTLGVALIDGGTP